MKISTLLYLSLSISVIQSQSTTFDLWHITDVHVDPYYVTGAIAGSGCYCELHDMCPRMPLDCNYTLDPTLQALIYGMPEDNCATPFSLWSATMEFLTDAVHNNPSPLALFTGDFGEAGLSASCSDSSPAQDQIINIINNGMMSVRTALRYGNPNAVVYGSLGNHDTTPGDIYYGTNEMQWLYNNLTKIFGNDFSNDKEALSTLLHGGWYVTPVTSITTGPGLYIIALNTNYWTTLNSQLTNTSSEAYQLGQEQFIWLNTTLSNLTIQNKKVLISGHIPPGGFWLTGYWTIFRKIMTLYPNTVIASFFGHTHVDQFTIVRSCQAIAPNQPIDWIITPNVNWCSGGNLAVGDVFNAGLWQNDNWCPLLPSGTPTNTSISMCETVCANYSSCAGFTWYPDASPAGSCCFRTSVSNMPYNASSDAICYAKPECADGDGNPLHVLYATPSLTEGFPASNPGIRKFMLDSNTYEILDMITYYGNITAANDEHTFIWEQEYSMKLDYSLPDLSAISINNLVNNDMVLDNSSSWTLFWNSYRKQYFGPSYVPCDGLCKVGMLQFLNGTTAS